MFNEMNSKQKHWLLMLNETNKKLKHWLLMFRHNEQKHVLAIQNKISNSDA